MTKVKLLPDKQYVFFWQNAKLRKQNFASKDQSKNGGLVFLKHNVNYPNIKDISMMKGREPQPLMDCNGLDCGVRDLDERNSTEQEINFNNQLQLFAIQ